MLGLMSATAAVIIAALVLDRLTDKTMEISIETAGSVQGRDAAECHVIIKNTGKLPVIFRKMTFEVCNTFTGERKRRRIRVNVMPKTSSEIDMGMKIRHCGKIRCEVKSGWLSKRRESCNYTVLPELFPIHIVYDLHESDIYDCETYSPYRKGQDYSEVFQIREYTPGDSIRHIHWKLSGRSDDLFIKEASFPLDKSIMVVMDKSLSDGVCDPETAEALAALTVSICRYLSDEELNYQLVWNDPTVNSCEDRKIQFEDELLDAIPGLLTGQVTKSAMDCAQVYLQTVGPCTATHVIYISCGVQAAERNVFEGCRITDIDAGVKNYRNAYREIDLY